MLRFFIFAISIFLLPFQIQPSKAQNLPTTFVGEKPFLLEKRDTIYSLGADLGYYLDSTWKADLAQIRLLDQKGNFLAHQNTTLNFGNAEYPVWCVLNLENKTAQQDWILEIASPNLDVFVCTPDSTGTYQCSEVIGRFQPYKKRSYRNNHLFFDIKLPQNQAQRIYLRGRSEYMQFEVNVGTLSAFFERNHQSDFLYGIFYGFIVLIALYNLFLYLTVRDHNYFLYVLYLIFTGISSGQLKGFVFEYVCDDLNVFLGENGPITISVAGIFSMIFALSFLNIRQIIPSLRWGYYFFMAVYVVAILVLWIPEKGAAYASIFNQLSVFFGAFYLIYTAIRVYLRKYAPAKYFFTAWGIYMIFIVIFVLAGIGVLPYNNFTRHALEMGTVVEILLLSFALADKINFYKKEKEKAQAEALRISEENRRITEDQNKILEHRVQERTEELNLINEELSLNLEQINEQHRLIEQKNQDITDSITYAKRIQEAMLPEKATFERLLPNSMVFFRPRDIVSGDFYFLVETQDAKAGKAIVVAAVDCTGHGVPGAFMSLIANDLLHEIVVSKQITEPDQILNLLDSGISKLLRQEETKVQDGMDIALCTLYQEESRLAFAGAKNSLFYVEQGQPKIVKADSKGIGSTIAKEKNFRYQKHNIPILPNQTFYLYTDGYQDQFGGREGRKFMSKNFKQLLLQIHDLPFETQRQQLENTLNQWVLEGIGKGAGKQIDDILVIAFRI
ncbi:7TM diverse intracellular signaling domain-containing protein [Hugenholtzia roseola]|uniref:7TM diverse intracellular signaling domain-containing protein n=1 Tax=Hugenholtzia roseola TaxID=1002 RepID=UPI0013785D8A|nr:7TM diverse intracellular signaling domain-containing protein [Hugenholtzia roseola]